MDFRQGRWVSSRVLRSAERRCILQLPAEQHGIEEVARALFTWTSRTSRTALHTRRAVPSGAMTPSEFIVKWRASELKESSAAQEHFIDLCRLLGEPTPAEADPTGEHYCFERGARKDTGGDGWADVWKRHCFAWEYKGKHADLDVAFGRLRQYALALENPPLLIVSDMVRA